MRQLCILRHAEAVSPDHADDDQSRVLTAHGQVQCADRARHLATPFQRVIASPAIRTVTTAKLVFGVAPKLEPKLYNAPWHMMLKLIAATPDSVESLAVVGHNPGISELAGYLSGKPERLSPASLLIFEVEENWPRIGHSTVRLVTARTD